MARKTAKEKYENSNKKGGFKKQTDKGLMYISTPKEIGDVIKTVGKGKLITSKQIADKLRDIHKVDFTCQLTTGIFISVLANYTEEEGKEKIPYWRVVKDKGILYDKYLGVLSKQKSYLEGEGYKIIQKGKAKFAVENFEKYLV